MASARPDVIRLILPESLGSVVAERAIGRSDDASAHIRCSGVKPTVTPQAPRSPDSDGDSVGTVPAAGSRTDQ